MENIENLRIFVSDGEEDDDNIIDRGNGCGGGLRDLSRGMICVL